MTPSEVLSNAARATMDAADENYSSAGPAIDNRIKALTFATLALVEEQRTTNTLIRDLLITRVQANKL